MRAQPAQPGTGIFGVGDPAYESEPAAGTASVYLTRTGGRGLPRLPATRVEVEAHGREDRRQG